MAKTAPAGQPLQLPLFDSASALPVGPATAGPATFLHPQASREIVLDGHRIAYAWRRARRRSIGFVIGGDGLAVSAPRWVTIADVERALQAKSAWILRKLLEQDERRRRLQAAQIDWRDGAQVPFLGERLTVTLDANVDGTLLHGEAGAGKLHVGLPADAAPAQIRDAVQSWLQRQALQLFEQRCREYAARLGVTVKRLRLSAAQTRWGSASADGSIRLHWRLVHFRLPTIDYVIVHELAHLREMNHSPAFWDVVRSVVPDYEGRRRALKETVIPHF